MKYDEVYDFVGQVGVFQVCASACLLLYCLFGLDSITMIFVGAEMPHFCQVEELENLSYDLQKYIAIPLDADGVSSSCEMFDLDYGNYSTEDYLTWNRTSMLDNNSTGVVPCSRWIYEQVVFVSTIVSRFGLVCEWSFLLPLVSTVYMAGTLVGGAFGGPLADRIGRKPSVLVFLLLKVIGIFLSTFSPNYVTFVVGRFIMGAGSIGCYNTCYVLTMELVGPKYRSLMGGSVQAATSICFVLQPLIAYLDRHDVRYQMASMAPNALILLITFVVCESPRWLVVTGRHDNAEKLFRQMALVNGRSLPPDFSTESIEIEESSTGSCLLLFRFPVLRLRTIICAYLCFTSNLLYFSLSLNTGALSGDIFLNSLISAALELPSIVVCIFLVDWKFLGRRLSTFLTFFLSSVSCLLCIPMVLMDVGVGETVLSIIGKSLAVMTYTVIFILSSEIFPTEVRNAGIGLVQVFGSVANMAASFIGEPMSRVWRPLPYVVLGATGSLAAVFSLLLPETLGHPLPDTIEQAEQFKGGKILRTSVDGSRSDATDPTADEGSTERKTEEEEVEEEEEEEEGGGGGGGGGEEEEGEGKANPGFLEDEEEEEEPNAIRSRQKDVTKF